MLHPRAGLPRHVDIDKGDALGCVVDLPDVVVISIKGKDWAGVIGGATAEAEPRVATVDVRGGAPGCGDGAVDPPERVLNGNAVADCIGA